MSCTDSCPLLHWGNRRSHCGSCHKTFTSVSPFDLHRRGGRCVIPEGMTERDGLWGMWGSKTRRFWE